jgi:hypothetical protein
VVFHEGDCPVVLMMDGYISIEKAIPLSGDISHFFLRLIVGDFVRFVFSRYM